MQPCRETALGLRLHADDCAREMIELAERLFKADVIYPSDSARPEDSPITPCKHHIYALLTYIVDTWDSGALGFIDPSNESYKLRNIIAAVFNRP